MLKHGDIFWSYDLFSDCKPKRDTVDTIHQYTIQGEPMIVIKSAIDGGIYKLGYTAFEDIKEWKRKS